MLAVAGERRNATTDATKDCQEEIEKRKRGENEREEPTGSNVVVDPIEVEGEKRDDKAERGAAGISHEDPGGREVKREKSEASTEKDPRHETPDGQSGIGVERRITERDESGNSSSEAVRAVEKIERVDEDCDEKTGEHDVKQGHTNEFQAPGGLADENSCEQLGDQANDGREIHQIVKQTDIPDHHKSETNSGDVRSAAKWR